MKVSKIKKISENICVECEYLRKHQNVNNFVNRRFQFYNDAINF